MGENENPDDFDPTMDTRFLKNLEKTLESSEYGNEVIDIDTGDTTTSILTIGEDGENKEGFKEVSLPVIDTSSIYEEEMPMEKEVDDDVIENISSQLASQVGMEYIIQEEQRKKVRPAGKKPVWLLPALVAAGVFLVGGLFLFVSKTGRNFLLSHGIGKLFADNATYMPEGGRKVAKGILFLLPSFAGDEPDPGSQVTPGPDQESPTPEPSLEPSVTEVPPEPEEIIRHFLVLGMDDAAQGGEVSSDLIMMVTVKESGEVKLTTILRDLFVSMPGRGEDKLCLAHARGGIGLVYDTLEENLGIRPDGYFLFSYDKFRSFIDRVGGVNLSLTAKEADYLNKTNFISKPENRVMVNGENHLNGDQALGYCRIRHVGTAQNEYNDIGRTARCQRVIMALYEQNRGRGIAELYGILTECFRMLTTDITGEECSNYLNMFLNMPKVTFSSYRIPAEGSYTTSIIRGRAALVADLGQNRALWQEFLFPKKAEQEDTVTEPVDVAVPGTTP
ncbi:MAG: LCP family protein [Lachnospiraceae bacterium]|nr:LCP family protein [Lachnospiraceae bacterium]